MKTSQQGIESVLMTADTIGGVWTYAMELAAALERKEVRVVLATMGAPLSHKQIEDTKRIKTIEVFESGFRLEWMHDPWENVRLAGEWLLRLEGYMKPDIIHLNGYAHGQLPFKAPAVVVGHSCCLSWWEAVRGGSAPPEWDRYKEEVEAGLMGAAEIAAPTRAMLSSLQKFYEFEAPCRVIPNGRDAMLFRPTKEKGEYIFTAGRLWDEAKNAAALEAVAGSLDWPVFAAGPAEHPSGKALKDGAIKTLGVFSTSELSSWLSRAPIFALPALYEPFGLTVLEAALSGAALVLGDIPSLRETWDGAALFVDPRDHQALKKTIGLLIHDKSFREKLGQDARERALEYSPDIMADGYLEMFRTALYGETEAVEGISCGL